MESMKQTVKALEFKRSLLARINRALLKDSEPGRLVELVATKPGTRNRSKLGQFYLANGPWIVECDCDPELLGRGLGVR
jgi:hypothetical protein